MPILLEIPRDATPAQRMIAQGYSDHEGNWGRGPRNLNFLTGFNDITDFVDGIKLVPDYNEFDAEKVIKAWDDTLLGYTEMSHGQVMFGRSGSPIMHIKAFARRANVDEDTFDDKIYEFADKTEASEVNTRHKEGFGAYPYEYIIYWG